jgi:hypothetical protein
MTSWDDYFTEVKPKLGARAQGFEKIFAYLDETTNPTIIETGTYREENNFTGDGCSTLLFDNYVNDRGGNVISIDNDPKACALASANTSNLTEVVESDSVEFLGTLRGNATLLYLDSYNIQNWQDDWAPAAHHLKELFAAKDIIQHDTLIVIDDNRVTTIPLTITTITMTITIATIIIITSTRTITITTTSTTIHSVVVY